MNVEYEKAPDHVVPKCPYCKAELTKVWLKTKGTGFIGQNQIMMCPHCETFLGYGAWRR